MSSVTECLNNVNLFSNEVWAKHLSHEMIDLLPQIEGICERFLTERRGRTLIQEILDQDPARGRHILERLSKMPEFPDFVIHFDSLGRNLLIRAFEKKRPEVTEPIGTWLQEHRETQAPLLACFEALVHPEDERARERLTQASNSDFAFALFVEGTLCQREKRPNYASSYYHAASNLGFHPATFARANVIFGWEVHKLYEQVVPFISQARVEIVKKGLVLMNLEQLREFLRPAVEKGNPEAYFLIGNSHNDARVKRHYLHEALRLLEEQGDTNTQLFHEVCVTLGRYYLSRDRQMAIHFSELAGNVENFEDPDYQFMYLIDLVYENDSERSAYWNRRLVAMGHLYSFMEKK